MENGEPYRNWPKTDQWVVFEAKDSNELSEKVKEWLGAHLAGISIVEIGAIQVTHNDKWEGRVLRTIWYNQRVL